MKFNKDRNQILVQCYHCGNTGWLDICNTHVEDFNEIDEKTRQIIYHEEIQYIMLSCPVCQGITIVSRYTGSGYQDFDGTQIYDDSIVYPDIAYEASDKHIPESIRTAFEAALKVKKIDSALCLTALRRTLEQICKDKGSTKKSLNQMIIDLVDKNVLPETLKDACWIIRTLGNEGAHGDKISVQSHYIKQVIGFIELLINYLYILPARVTHLKETIKSNTTSKGEDT